MKQVKKHKLQYLRYNFNKFETVKKSEFQVEVPPDRNSTNIAYQNSINQNDIEKNEFLGSHKNGKVDEKANKFVLPIKRKVKK